MYQASHFVPFEVDAHYKAYYTRHVPLMEQDVLIPSMNLLTPGFCGSSCLSIHMFLIIFIFNEDQNVKRYALFIIIQL